MSFFKIIKEDFCEPKRQDPAFNSWIELFFNYPGVWALINHRFAHFFYTKGFKRIARVISGVSKFLTSVDLHPGAKIGRNVFFDHATGIVIGQTAVIGNNVLIYQGVTLGGVSLHKGKRHPTLKSGVVIGAGAKVLGNITIGENSKVGANSVVVRDVPDDCTAVGIPARIIGGSEKQPLAHDKIPDINKELFIYLFEKIELLESILDDKKSIKNHSLDEKYRTFINSLKK